MLVNMQTCSCFPTRPDSAASGEIHRLSFLVRYTLSPRGKKKILKHLPIHFILPALFAPYMHKPDHITRFFVSFFHLSELSTATTKVKTLSFTQLCLYTESKRSNSTSKHCASFPSTNCPFSTALYSVPVCNTKTSNSLAFRYLSLYNTDTQQKFCDCLQQACLLSTFRIVLK